MKKHEMIEAQMLKKEERRRKRFHIATIILFQYCKEVKRKFEYRQKAVYDALHQIRSAIRMQRNMRRMLFQFGHNFEERIKRKAKK